MNERTNEAHMKRKRTDIRQVVDSVSTVKATETQPNTQRLLKHNSVMYSQIWCEKTRKIVFNGLQIGTKMGSKYKIYPLKQLSSLSLSAEVQPHLARTVPPLMEPVELLQPPGFAREKRVRWYK